MKTHFRARSAPVTKTTTTTTTTKKKKSPIAMATSPCNISSPCGSPLPRRAQTAFGKASSPRGATDRDLTLSLKRSMSEPFSRKRSKQNPLFQRVGAAALAERSAVMPSSPAAAAFAAAAAAAGAGSTAALQQRPPSSERVFVCFYCQGEFPDALSLTKHSRSHGGATPYSCTQCGRMFALYSSLMTHQRSHAPDDGRWGSSSGSSSSGAGGAGGGGRHAAAAPEVFRCRRCPSTFLNEASLKAHLRRHLDACIGPEAKPYECPTCHEWVSNEGSLKIHMQRHEGFETPRVCSLCGTSFSCDAFLRAHGKLHVDAREPTTRCVICIRPFRRSRVLLRHSDVHAEERQNVCDSCERRFPKVAGGSWRRMQMLLPEERQFQCAYCGVRFPRLHQLAAHEAGHTDPPPAPTPTLTLTSTRPSGFASASAAAAAAAAATAMLSSQQHLPSVVVN